MKKLDFIKVLFASVIILLIAISCIDQETDVYTRQDELNDIDNYINALVGEGYDVDTTVLGVYYVVINEGEGDLPQHGDSLIVKYNGFFIDDTMFDSSANHNDEGTFNFRYIENPMIPGFEDGLSMMNKGAKLHLVIPSALAYGENGGGVMSPFTTLLFEVEMIDIIPL